MVVWRGSLWYAKLPVSESSKWDESPRSRGLKKGRERFDSGKPPVLILIRHPDGPVRFLACRDLKDADEDIAVSGARSVILCTDDYTIYSEIEKVEGVEHQIAVHAFRHTRDQLRSHKHSREPS